MKSERGYTLLELVVAMAVFGIFLAIVGTLTVELRGQDKRHPVNFMTHPQIGSVLFRLRRDVLDAAGSDPYPDPIQFPGSPMYTQSQKLLIVRTIVGGGEQIVIWDFRKPREARRISYNVGVATEWVARGLPPAFDVSFDAVETVGHAYGVRVTATDPMGMLAIDEYLQPRAHE